MGGGGLGTVLAAVALSALSALPAMSLPAVGRVRGLVTAVTAVAAVAAVEAVEAVEAVAGVAGATAGVGGAPTSAGRYRPPVTGPLVVVRPFDHLASPYAAGHRGVDLQVGAGGTVVAAGAGTVVFAGDVAGRGVVVVAHADGLRTEYEPVVPAVAVGAVVPAGAGLGTVHGVHGGFPADAVLHWGARRGEVYLDPLTLLRPLGAVRLVPWSPSPPGALAAVPARPRAP